MESWHRTQKVFKNGTYGYIWEHGIKELENLFISFKFKLQTTSDQTITGTSRIIERGQDPLTPKSLIDTQNKVLDQLFQGKRRK
jgi:hypothetical protein